MGNREQRSSVNRREGTTSATSWRRLCGRIQTP